VREAGASNGAAQRTLRVCALYPDLMNIYADRGNLLMLERAVHGAASASS